jgi:hypothetical protein
VTTTATLGVVTDLFRRFHAEGVVYCHWKSNEHLDASMVGETDFDLLVDRQDALAVAEIFSQMNVKRFVVAPFHQYPGVEDYLCVDRDTAKLIHLHVHYQLTVGERLLNGYRVPWEELVLSTRVLDERHEIYVADPHVELVLLVTRAALKLRLRDLLLGMFRRTHFQHKVLVEFAWLVQRIERGRLLDVARPLVGTRAAGVLLEMVDAPPRKRRLLTFRRSAEPSLRSYRTYSTWGARIRRWLLEARTLWWWIENRYYGVPKNSSRTCPQGGVMIAFVSDDAALKSTIARAVAEWLAEEVAVVPITAATGVPVRARRARSLGKIVILNGWPHAEACPPDVVVKLHVAADIVGGVETLRYPPSARVVDIDANQPLERVLSEAKHAIWHSI